MIENRMPAQDTTVSDSRSKTPRTPQMVPGGREAPTHVTLAAVLQVREQCLAVLLWQRARDPFSGAWSLPGGYLESGHTLELSIRAHLARKVDVSELSWLEQLETLSDPGRHPGEWQLATAYLGLVPR